MYRLFKVPTKLCKNHVKLTQKRQSNAHGTNYFNSKYVKYYTIYMSYKNIIYVDLTYH